MKRCFLADFYLCMYIFIIIIILTFVFPCIALTYQRLGLTVSSKNTEPYQSSVSGGP